MHYWKILAVIIILFTNTTWAQEEAEIKELYYSADEFGPIWIIEKQGQRCLTFKPPSNPEAQSCMLPGEPSITLFDYPKIAISSIFLQDNPRKILMIGLGGASIAKGFNKLLPNVEFDIVEINPLIPKLAKEFFAFDPPPGTKIHTEDGVKFVNSSPSESYDLIIVDAFTKDYIPPAMLHRAFSQDLKRVLKEDGVLCVNTLTGSPYERRETQIFKDMFGKIYGISNSSNRVIFAKKGRFPDIEQIEHTSLFWRFRMAPLGIDQRAMIELFKQMQRL